MSFLLRLKEKPSHVKTQYAFVGATVMTAAIALVWTTTLPARFSAISASIDAVDVEDVANVKEGFDALREEELGSGDSNLEVKEIFQNTDLNAYTNTAPSGALGDLGGWSEPAPTSTPTYTEQQPQPIETAEKPLQASTTPPTIVPVPTVILIGTTTKKIE